MACVHIWVPLQFTRYSICFCSVSVSSLTLGFFCLQDLFIFSRIIFCSTRYHTAPKHNRAPLIVGKMLWLLKSFHFFSKHLRWLQCLVYHTNALDSRIQLFNLSVVLNTTDVDFCDHSFLLMTVLYRWCLCSNTSQLFSTSLFLFQPNLPVGPCNCCGVLLCIPDTSTFDKGSLYFDLPSLTILINCDKLFLLCKCESHEIIDSVIFTIFIYFYADILPFLFPFTRCGTLLWQISKCWTIREYHWMEPR